MKIVISVGGSPGAYAADYYDNMAFAQGVHFWDGYVDEHGNMVFPSNGQLPDSNPLKLGPVDGDTVMTSGWPNGGAEPFFPLMRQ